MFPIEQLKIVPAINREEIKRSVRYWDKAGTADGGKVVGALKASADAPVANAIPWLWLDIKSREGTGVLTQAAGILRVATVGGRAPADGCDEAHGATELRVAYGAAYYFVK